MIHRLLIGFFCFCSLALSAQNGADMQGRVVDAKTGLPLSKAGILLMPGSFRTLTDDSGRFVIHAIEQRSEVRVTFIGYVPQTVQVSFPQKKELWIPLEPSA